MNTDWDREQADTPLYESDSAMSWPYLLLLGVFTSVILGSAVAFAFNNWPLIEIAASDLFR
jgi:hypothetical protein